MQNNAPVAPKTKLVCKSSRCKHAFPKGLIFFMPYLFCWVAIISAFIVFIFAIHLIENSSSYINDPGNFKGLGMVIIAMLVSFFWLVFYVIFSIFTCCLVFERSEKAFIILKLASIIALAGSIVIGIGYTEELTQILNRTATFNYFKYIMPVLVAINVVCCFYFFRSNKVNNYFGVINENAPD